jgi:hypothetical protein
MKTINKLWIKRLTEEEMYPEPENAPASYMENLITHYDFAQFLKNLGFKYGWTTLASTDEGIIHQATYDWRKNTKSTTDHIERIFKISIGTLNGTGPSHELVHIYAPCTLTRYSHIEHSLKFAVSYAALIRPAIPNSAYVECTVKDFVVNVLALMKKIVPQQSDEESSKLLKAIKHQFKEINQP